MRTLFLGGLCLLLACSHPKRVTVEVTIDPSMEAEGQWAYLIVLWGNQADILDSCRVRNTAFRLQGELPFDETFANVFLRCGSYNLILAPGEQVTMHIDSLTNSWAPEVSGSYATGEFFRNHRQIRAIVERTHPFAAAMDTLRPSSAAYRAMRDSLERIREGIPATYARLLSSRSAFCAAYGCMAIADQLSEDSLRRLSLALRDRFPRSVYLPSLLGLVGQEQIEPVTERSIRAHNRKAQVMGYPLPFPEWKAKEPEKPVEDPTIAAYAAGDTVEPFTLPGTDGKPIALAQIATPYLLIDFWASWCGPCRREVPHLKEAAGKYRDVLTVLAVSLDEDAEAWRKAIGEDGSEGLVRIACAQRRAIQADRAAFFGHGHTDQFSARCRAPHRCRRSAGRRACREDGFAHGAAGRFVTVYAIEPKK